MNESTRLGSHFSVIANTKNVSPNNKVSARERSARGQIIQTGNHRMKIANKKSVENSTQRRGRESGRRWW